MTIKVFRQGQIVTTKEIYTNYVLVIRGDAIAYICPEKELDETRLNYENEEVIEYNLAGDILIPGLIDTHVHGAGGADIMDAGSVLNQMCTALLKEGTTAFLAATMSAKPKAMTKLFSMANEFLVSKNPSKTQLLEEKLSNENQKTQAGADFLGLHLEGPFISDKYLGAQTYSSQSKNEKTQDLNDLESVIKKYPELIKIMTFAIEEVKLDSLIELCHENNIIPSAGHTNANYEQMQKAIQSGLYHITHLFNAMPGIRHRDPGVVVAGLLDSKVKVELIADGIHIHPAVLKLVIKLKDPDSIILVSDGMRAVGMPDGNYQLGDQTVIVRHGTAKLANGAMAGSSKALLHGLRVLVHDLKLPVAQTVAYATFNPARLLGLENHIGSLEVGKEATFLRLSSDFSLKEVWQKGNLVFLRPDND